MTWPKTDLSLLVVGNIENWLGPDRELPQFKDTIFCAYKDLSLEILNKHQPSVILSPLVTSQYDVLELAVKLDQMNFSGRFRAITAPLPAPEIIMAEIRFECPALDFDLIVMQPDQNLHSV